MGNEYLDLLQSDTADQPQQPAAANNNDYLTILQNDQVQQDAALRGTLSQSVDTNPDEYARQKKIAGYLGYPTPAVETLPEQTRQQAALQHIDNTTRDTPTLRQRYTDADFAKLAHDDSGVLAGIERWANQKGTFDYLKQDFGAPAMKAFGFASLTAGGIPTLYDKAASLFSGQPQTGASDWWFNNITQPYYDRADRWADLGPNANLADRAIQTAGNLVTTLAMIAVTGPEAAAPALDASALDIAGSTLAHGTKAMALPALSDAVDTGRKVYAETGNGSAAAQAAEMQYATSTLGGILPLSAPGNLAMRLGTGAVSGAYTGELSREAMNWAMPQSMQQPFSADDMILSALTGSILGGVMGPRPEPGYHAEIRQTYTDAARAEKALADGQRLQALGEIAAGSKLRDRDPEAFRQYVADVTENGSLDAVYVDAKTLVDVLHQSGVDDQQLRDTMPDVAAQMYEALQTQGDVRIPVADYATHVAGGPVDQALLQHLKTDPEGQTYAQAQAFYQEQHTRLAEQAQRIVEAKTQDDATKAESDTIFNQIHDQLLATGRYSPDVARTNSTIATALYLNNAERAGLTPTELMRQFPLRVASEGSGLAQGEAAHRGAYDPATNTIALLKDADLSTFVHELGHHALEMTADLAVRDGAPGGIRSDMDTLLRWFGVDSLDTWHNLSLEEKRSYHEQFAQGFEKYLFEGKSPSLEMQPIFARIRAWMVQVYKQLTNLGVELTPEVRGVFDRLIASEDAIQHAEQVRSYAPLFKSAAEAGIPPEQFHDYMALGKEATDQAVGDLQSRSLRDMKWLANAKSRAMRDLQRQSADARRTVKEQVTKEVMAEPINQAREFLTSGKLQDRDRSNAERRMLDLVAGKSTKLDLGALKEMYGDDPAAPWRYLSTGKKGLAVKEGGLHPDLAAEMFGFDSGDRLVRELLSAENPKEKIDGITDQRMLEQHGELVDPQSIERAAEAAIHNEARARFIATGLKMLTKSPIPAKQIAKAATEAADTAIAAKRVRDLRPLQYSAAEAKANRSAIEKVGKDPEGAAQAQRAALLNNRLAKAAADAVEDVRKGVLYVKRLGKDSIRQKIDVDIRDQIDQLLERFDFRQVPPEGPSKQRMQLQQWVDSQKALGYAPLEVPDMLNEQMRMHYKDMTLEQFRGLIDTVKSLEQIGRERRTVTVDGQKLDIRQLVDTQLIPKMRARGEKFTDAQLVDRPRYGVDPLWRVTLDRLTSFLRAGLSELTRPDYKANKYDLHELLGPFQRSISERLLKAAYDFGDFMDQNGALKRQRMNEYGLDKDWQKSLDTVVSNHNLMDNSLAMPAKRRLTRGDLIGIALHVGNESNFDKLVNGMKWHPAEVWRTLHDNMSEKDWRAAQLMGELAGTKWDEMSAMNRRLGNSTPQKIEPRPFSTKYGEMPGWYSPISYDPIRSRLGAKKAEERAVDPDKGLFGRDYFRADTTTNGSLNARSAGYYDFVDLNWRPVERRISDTLRDLAYREALIDVHKIYGDKEFRAQFQRTYGPEEYKHFGDWLGRLVNADIGDERQSKLSSIMAASRRALVANGVAFRISTMLKHGGSAAFKSTGYFAGGGEKYFAQRVAQMSVNYTNEVAEALAKFPEIRQRLRQQDRDYAKAVESIFEPESIHGKAERFGHAGVSFLDFFTAVPTAHAAYDWAITEGVPKRLGGTGKPMSEADAIKFASKVVREAHGSTNEASQSLLINNKSELVKTLTTLHGFMNNAFGQNADALDKLLHAEGFGKPELLARVMMAQVVPALMAGWVTFGAPDENKDESGLGWAFHHIGGEFAGMLPMVRDAWSLAVEGRDNAGAAPWIRVLSDIHKAGTSIAKGEDAKHPIKDVGNVAGLLLPGLGQGGATAQFLYDVSTGEQHPETVGQWVRGAMSGNGRAH